MNREVADALARMEAALVRLESAVRRHFDVDARRSDIEVELGVMQEDRSRLASELDSATARLGQLESVNEHVGTRVATAIATLQEMLAAPPPPRPSAGSWDGRA